MGLRHESCLVITCDECDVELGNEDGGIIHFANAPEANAAAAEAGWLVKGDLVLCRVCVERAACGLFGHTWSDWIEESRPGQIHNGRRRYCGDCGQVERSYPDGSAS